MSEPSNRAQARIVLSRQQYVVMGAGLAAVTLVCLIILTPYPQILWARFVRLPHLQDEFGFRLGMVRIDADAVPEAEGFVEVVRDGRLGKAGIRVGDIPLAGVRSLCRTLETVGRGEGADLHVIHAERFRELLDEGSRGQGLSEEGRVVRLAPGRP